MLAFCDPQSWGPFKRELIAKKVKTIPVTSTHAISELVRRGDCVPVDLLLEAISQIAAEKNATPLLAELRKWHRSTKKAKPAPAPLQGAQGQIRGTFCETRKNPKRAFAPKSFRWKRNGAAWILVGCPKGKWAVKKKVCKVGLKAYTLLTPAKARCKKGSTRVTKR